MTGKTLGVTSSPGVRKRDGKPGKRACGAEAVGLRRREDRGWEPEVSGRASSQESQDRERTRLLREPGAGDATSGADRGEAVEVDVPECPSSGLYKAQAWVPNS